MKDPITELLASAAKTANLADNFDLSLMLGIIANARKHGRETELATYIAEFAITKGLAGKFSAERFYKG